MMPDGTSKTTPTAACCPWLARLRGAQVRPASDTTFPDATLQMSRPSSPTQSQPSGASAPRPKTCRSLRSMSPWPVVIITARCCCDATDDGVVLHAALRCLGGRHDPAARHSQSRDPPGLLGFLHSFSRISVFWMGPRAGVFCISPDKMAGLKKFFAGVSNFTSAAAEQA